jgi:hypothetical protein
LVLTRAYIAIRMVDSIIRTLGGSSVSMDPKRIPAL